MSGIVWRLALVVVLLAPAAARARTPLPPYDFTGAWTGLILAGGQAYSIDADLASQGAKKFTGDATVEGVPCTLRGKRKKKLVVRLKCANRAKGKFSGILDLENDSMTGAGRLKQGRHKASAQLVMDRVVVVDPVCGNGTREAGEQCDDGNTTGGDGCSATCAVEVAAELDEVEPNGSAAQATDVPTLPALVHGAVSPSIDEDFFRIEITGSDLILETFDGDGPGSCAGLTDTVLELRGPDGVSVVQVDNDGGIGKCSRLELHGLAPGVYYPCVRGFLTRVDAYQLLVVAP